jgi:hypothetical protein
MKSANRLAGALLTHDADTKRGVASHDPAKLQRWALWLLANRKIKPGTAAFRRALESQDDPVAHHAAWLFCAIAETLKRIEQLPAELSDTARELFTLAFHAAARHESITVEKRYRQDVQARRSQRAALDSNRPNNRKFTPVQYETASKQARSRKELFALLGVSGQAVRKFEKNRLRTK